MTGNRDPKKALGYPEGRRKRGNPRTIWIDNIEDGLKRMSIKIWRTKLTDKRE